jgi:hypothetical protein
MFVGVRFSQYARTDLPDVGHKGFRADMLRSLGTGGAVGIVYADAI